MTPPSPDRALDALLAAETTEPREFGAADSLAGATTLDRRVSLWLRAIHGPDRNFSDRERAIARGRILDAMAIELAGKTEEQSGNVDIRSVAATSSAAVQSTNNRRQHRSFLASLRNALLFPLVAPAHAQMRFLTVSVIMLLFAGAAWTGAWFYAASSAETAIANWIGSDSTHRATFTCGSREITGFPLQVNIRCTDPKAIVVSEQSTYAIDAKELRMVASILQLESMVANVTGPLTIAEPGKPALLVGNWAAAQTTLHGKLWSFDQIAAAFEGFQFYRETQSGMKPLLTGDRFEFNVKPDPTRGKRDFNIAVRVEGGSIPAGGSIPPDAIAADITAVLHDAGPPSSALLFARLRAWQASGGRLEFASVRVQQGDAIATASGGIGLSQSGRLDGSLRTTVTGDYVRVAEALMQGRGGTANRVAQPSPGIVVRSLPTAPTSPAPRRPQDDSATAPVRSQEVPIRFDDGAVYVGPTLLGTVPSLF